MTEKLENYVVKDYTLEKTELRDYFTLADTLTDLEKMELVLDPSKRFIGKKYSYYFSSSFYIWSGEFFIAEEGDINLPFL